MQNVFNINSLFYFCFYVSKWNRINKFFLRNICSVVDIFTHNCQCSQSEGKYIRNTFFPGVVFSRKNKTPGIINTFYKRVSLKKQLWGNLESLSLVEVLTFVHSNNFRNRTPVQSKNWNMEREINEVVKQINISKKLA